MCEKFCNFSGSWFSAGERRRHTVALHPCAREALQGVLRPPRLPQMARETRALQGVRGSLVELLVQSRVEMLAQTGTFMRAFNVSVIGAAIAVATHGIASAGGPPELNVRPSCSAAARGSVTPGRTQSCLDDEHTAKDALVRDWSNFSPVARAQCLGMNRTGGPPSYVELLVCLEMMRDAGKNQ